MFLCKLGQKIDSNRPFDIYTHKKVTETKDIKMKNFFFFSVGQPNLHIFNVFHVAHLNKHSLIKYMVTDQLIFLNIFIIIILLQSRFVM